MATTDKSGVKQSGELRVLMFTVIVTGGVGSFTFPQPIFAVCHHRQLVPPANSGAFSFYVTNAYGIYHDVHSITGFTDIDDIALFVNEVTFDIVNAATDGTYTVAIWLT